MADKRDDKWEERGEKAYSDLTYKPKRTLAKWGAGLLAIIIGLSILFAAISWVGSWGGEAKRITSPDNVREQNTAIIDDYESLKAEAGNACAAQNSPSSKDDPTLVERPDFAYAAKYRQTAVDYNRRMNNLYEAQAVRNLPLPSNLRSYPKYAPTLKQMKAEVC